MTADRILSTRGDLEAFELLKAELDRAFAAPDESYKPLTAAEVIARNRNQPGRVARSQPNH